MGAHSSRLSRRAFLKAASIGAGAAFCGGLAQVARAAKNDVWIRMYASVQDFPILPGNLSQVYRYTAGLRHGPRNTIARIPNSFLGPIFNFRTGQKVQLDFVNNLPEPSVVHFHGLNVPEEMDGHPLYTVAPGQSFTHQFEVINRAGTYWYHPHPDMRTGFQANKGLAGVIIINDDEEDRLELPRGECDAVFVIQDKRYSPMNQIQHSTGSQVGYLGNVIHVNGTPNFRWNCGTRLYRIRLLNGSNSRIYKLAWSDGQPMFVIGTTGGLLAETVEKPYLMLGPGDRIEIIADFRTKQVGEVVKLMSLAFPMGGPGSGFPAQGTEMEIMSCEMSYPRPEKLEIPTTLTKIVPYVRSQAVNADNSRVFATEYMDGMWTINGRVFELTGVVEEEKVWLDDLEVWEFRNDLPADQHQPHPMHLHGAQFQISNRWTNTDEAWYDEIREGYVDEGWHDTVLLFPGERVEFLVKHGPYRGLFLMHCHNLEHEDMGMMRNFLIQ